MKHYKSHYTIDQMNAMRHPDSVLTILEILVAVLKDGTGAKCLCKCGNVVIKRLNRVVTGHTKSCGCITEELLQKKRKKYKFSTPELSVVYHNMIQRCYNKKHLSYLHYGGKGVIVCEEWKNNPDAFYEWASKNGFQKRLQLDKDIKGNSRIYSPETCCFVTGLKNMNNLQGQKKFTYQNQQYSISELARLSGKSLSYLRYRMNRLGEDAETAITRKKYKQHFSKP